MRTYAILILRNMKQKHVKSFHITSKKLKYI